jgi:hypothetical protein
VNKASTKTLCSTFVLISDIKDKPLWMARQFEVKKHANAPRFVRSKDNARSLTQDNNSRHTGKRQTLHIWKHSTDLYAKADNGFEF